MASASRSKESGYNDDTTAAAEEVSMRTAADADEVEEDSKARRRKRRRQRLSFLEDAFNEKETASLRKLHTAPNKHHGNDGDGPFSSSSSRPTAAAEGERTSLVGAAEEGGGGGVPDDSSSNLSLNQSLPEVLDTSTHCSSISINSSSFKNSNSRPSVRSRGGGGGGGEDEESPFGVIRELPHHHQTHVMASRSIRGARVGAGRRSSITLDKLRFEKLQGLIGRENELDILKNAFLAVESTSCSRKEDGSGGGDSKKDSSNSNNSGGSKQLVTIGGAAGTGKSALAQEAQTFKTRKDDRPVFYLTGKFEMNAKDQPYQALADACYGFCDELLQHKDQSISRIAFREYATKFQEEIDPDGLVLLQKVIPGFDEIVENIEGASTSLNEEVNYLEAILAFQDAFKRFLKVISTFGKIVFIIDDLQWADDGSMEVIESILKDKTSNAPPMLIIVTYRDGEIDPEVHKLPQLAAELKASNDPGVTVHEILLNNLTHDDVGTLIDTVMTSTSNDVTPLAQIVHSKTMGNPFHVKQFLLSLQDSGLIEFSFGLMSWYWDVNAVQEKSRATDNVVELVTAKLEKLDRVLQLLLLRIACLSSPIGAYSLDILSKHCCEKEKLDRMLSKYSEKALGRLKQRNQIPNQDASDTVDEEAPATTSDDGDEALKLMVPEYTIEEVLKQEQLLVETRGGNFRWEHDKVQEAALGLESDEEMASIKFDVGTLLFDQLSLKDLTKETFVITNLLNAQACSLPESDERREEIARLNLLCGKAAMASSAFVLAAEYFSNGIKLLPDDKWATDRYALSLELYSNAGEAYFCVGDHAKTEEFCNEVFALPSATMLQKRRMYNVRCHSLGAQGQTADAKDLTLKILEELGCHFPKRNLSLMTIAGVMRNMSSHDKNMQLIEKAKPIESEEKKWAVYLLDRLATYAYQCDPDLLPLSFLKGLRWTINFGTTEMTSTILAFVAVLFGASLGDFAAGRKYCKLAIRYMNRKTESRTLLVTYAFVMHLQIPFEQCKRPLLNSYEAGLRSGDLESGFWSAFNFLELQMYTGANLQKILADMGLYASQMESHNHKRQLAMTKMSWQCALNLSKDEISIDLHKVKGSVFNEDRYIQEIAGNLQFALEWLHIQRVKTFSAFWFNKHELVVKLMETNDYHNFLHEKQQPGVTGNGPIAFNCAISCCSVARNSSTSNASRKKYKKIAKNFLSKFKGWTKKGNPNVIVYENLLEAEISCLDGNTDKAKKFYESAILLGGRWTLTNYRALSHERAGDHAHRIGDDDDMRYHYKHAIKLFDEWGARWRANVLREKVKK